MGLINILKGLTSPEVKGNACVNLQEKIYLQLAHVSPMLEPHEVLAQVWLSRRKLTNRALRKMPKELQRVAALSATQLFACIPPPDNARAMGIYFIYQELPDVYRRCPRFERELEHLIGPVIRATESDGIEEMYRRLNPKLSGDKLIAASIKHDPEFDSWLESRMAK